MTWCDVIAYVTWVGKWQHSTFFLKFVSCAIIWYKNVPLETSMESFVGKPMLWKFDLYFNQCVLQEDSITQSISMEISSSEYFYIRCIKWCKCLYIVYFKYIAHFNFYCNFWIHNFTIKCCLTFFDECRLISSVMAKFKEHCSIWIIPIWFMMHISLVERLQIYAF